MATSKSDKDIHIRRLGGTVKRKAASSGALGQQRKVSIPRPRSTAQVEKDALARQMGIRVAPRGRLSDAATGRLAGTRFDPREHPRDRKGRFKDK